MSQVLPLDYERSAHLGGSRGFLSTIGWAIYLGMSWTWCIGMFLPVLLMRDYGIWGWVVFAVPNVIGAAAMGWTIWSPQQSAEMVVAHRRMLIAFSFVTATFQIFFASWIFQRLGIDPDNFTRATLAAALMVVLIPLIRARGSARWIALGVLIVSCACWCQAWRSGQLDRILVFSYPWKHAPRAAIAPLAAVCALGFGLCPYLDLSFHRARQNLTGRDARLAFGVGFGVFFLSMIVFTLLYAVGVLGDMLDSTLGNGVFLWAISIHFLVQLAFTIGIHWNEAASAARGGTNKLFLACVISLLTGIGVWVASQHLHPRQYEGGEMIYRLFMGFYGLLFPAYVWICMLPTWGSPQPATRQSLVVFATSVILAGPFFWLGFIEGKMFWLFPGLAIVLLARLFVPWKDRADLAYNQA